MSTLDFRDFDNLLPFPQAYALKARVESESAWKLHEESFFSQFDCSWVRREFGRDALGEMSDELAFLHRVGAELIAEEMRAVVGEYFTIVAHKMVDGQAIGMHNDSPEWDRGRTENFRLLFYVDESFEDASGGHLFLFGSRNEADIAAAFRPNFNSGVILKLSDASLHAVGRIKRGTRYSIVVSYWAYPLLGAAGTYGARLAGCIKRLVGAGLECVGHSGTTFIYHLYNTFEILSRWNAPEDVRLAGLMHSALGRESIAPTNITEDELSQLAGGSAAELVRNLRDFGGKETRGLRESPDWKLLLIETANALEQAESAEDLGRVTAFSARLRGEGEGFRSSIEEAVRGAATRLSEGRTEHRESCLIHRDR